MLIFMFKRFEWTWNVDNSINGNNSVDGNNNTNKLGLQLSAFSRAGCI